MKADIGKTFGQLTVLEEKRKNKKTYYYCQCSCGNKKWIRADRIKAGITISCGCYNKENNYKKAVDIKNKVFGRLRALEPTAERDKYNGSVIWKCKCSCGNWKNVSYKDLIDNSISSCGCLRKEIESKNGKKIGTLTKEFCVNNTNVRNLTMKTPKRNTSGIKGVVWDNGRKRWRAQIGFQNKNYYLGRYEKKEDAAKARKEAEEKIFGEFLKWYVGKYKK